jgi:hypothetical protein
MVDINNFENTNTNNTLSTPPIFYRQIKSRYWISTLTNIIKNRITSGDDTIVYSHQSGWVYLIQSNFDTNEFKCLTYKLSTNPCDINKELYNYTLKNGILMNETLYKHKSNVG